MLVEVRKEHFEADKGRRQLVDKAVHCMETVDKELVLHQKCWLDMEDTEQRLLLEAYKLRQSQSMAEA